MCVSIIFHLTKAALDTFQLHCHCLLSYLWKGSSWSFFNSIDCTANAKIENCNWQRANEKENGFVHCESRMGSKISALIELLYKLEVIFLALWILSLLWLIIIGDVRVFENSALYRIRRLIETNVWLFLELLGKGSCLNEACGFCIFYLCYFPTIY